MQFKAERERGGIILYQIFPFETEHITRRKGKLENLFFFTNNNYYNFFPYSL